MGANSAISWTTHTFNPWLGCQKVSPGCDHCYAEALMDHRRHRVTWGPHGERVRTSPANWKLPLRWARAARGTAERPRVFCASLADWLDNKVPDQWRTDLAEVIVATPELDWLLLTKRIENYPDMQPWDDIPDNVWLGVTAEDQPHFDRRWGMLSKIKAPVRFISYEPALGALERLRPGQVGPRPDWIICGGESGPGARFVGDPQFEGWARALRNNCTYGSVAFYMKQMPGKRPIPHDLMVREFPKARRMIL